MRFFKDRREITTPDVMRRLELAEKEILSLRVHESPLPKDKLEALDLFILAFDLNNSRQHRIDDPLAMNLAVHYRRFKNAPEHVCPPSVDVERLQTMLERRTKERDHLEGVANAARKELNAAHVIIKDQTADLTRCRRGRIGDSERIGVLISERDSAIVERDHFSAQAKLNASSVEDLHRKNTELIAERTEIESLLAGRDAVSGMRPADAIRKLLLVAKERDPNDRVGAMLEAIGARHGRDHIPGPMESCKDPLCRAASRAWK